MPFLFVNLYPGRTADLMLSGSIQCILLAVELTDSLDLIYFRSCNFIILENNNNLILQI